MDARQIELVWRSFAKVVPIRAEAAALFYQRLFALDPDTRALFRGDIAAQGAKLMAALSTVVHALDRLDTVAGKVRALARRHVHYGVDERHYATVGAALLWTLEQGLGPDEFTPEVRDAWSTAYALLSGTMIEAAREEMMASLGAD
jgi:hemoglobin-like flavoprotein